ncbi:6438_t:CDS:2, partial [Acaulospora morrowiae]
MESLLDIEYQEWLDNALINNEIRRYDFGDFGDFQEIGSGAYGTVYSAKLIPENRIVALKSITVCPRFTFELLVNELKHCLKTRSHENIIDFYGIAQK